MHYINCISSRQCGAAMLAFLLILIAASSYALVTKLNANVRTYTRDSSSLGSLNDAKAALIGYAVNYPLDHAGKGPGYLPCPDINNNGSAGSSCSLSGNTTIGRIPWKTLELDHLRDAAGETLWYAVADNFRSNPSLDILNSETPAQFTLDGNTDVVAVIIAPGSVIGAQERDRTDTNISTEIGNYLEDDNNDFDIDFISVDPDASNINDFNDVIITITRDELMEAVEKRVLGEVKSALSNYKTTHGAYPWVSVFTDPKAVVRQLTGTADAGSNATTLVDSANNFTLRGVTVGDDVYNITDGSLGIVSAVSANSLTISSLSLGTEDDFDTGDGYVIVPKSTSSILTNVATVGGDNNTLADSVNDLTQIGAEVGDVIDNITDGSSATITSISTNEIEVDGLSGGTDNQFQTNDDYQIRTNYGQSTNSSSSTTQLDDSNKNFIAMGIQAGELLINHTDGSIGKVSAVVDADTLTVEKLEFGSDNTFEANDYYSLPKYNTDNNTRNGLLSIHETGKHFSTSFDIDLNISLLQNSQVSFDSVGYPAVDATYSAALETHIRNYYAAPFNDSFSISLNNGVCRWFAPDIAECYGPYTSENINISGTITSGFNTAIVNDSNADFVTDGIKRGDIVQNYDDEYFVVSGTADAGTRGTATGASIGLVLADTNNNFVNLGVAVGDTITNVTDGSSGTVSTVAANQITADALTGGTDNDFDSGDTYQVTGSAKMYDAGTNLSTNNVSAYQYLIHNNTTGIRAVITDVDTDNSLSAVEFANQGSSITFSPGDSFSIYTPGIVVVSARNSSTQLTTTRSGNYNPDFDLIGSYEEYYRILPAANSTANSTVSDVDSTGSTDRFTDTSASFFAEGVTIGDIIENVTDGSFGEITNVDDAQTITTRLYGGSESDFEEDDVYIIYHDYVYSRVHEFHTRISGDVVTGTSAQERVREVCMNYTGTDCVNINPNQDFTGNGGTPLITVRDFEEDGLTEVGRAFFTPDTGTEGSLKVSNIDYYLSELGGDLPSWFTENDWHKFVYVAYSVGDVPGAASACVAGTNCLTLNGVGNPNNDKNAILIAAGDEINTTLDSSCGTITSTAQNRANGTINEYFESGNCSQGDDAFQKQTFTTTFNDLIRIVE